MEGGKGFPGGRKIGVKRRDGRGGDGAFNGEFLEMSCGDDGSGFGKRGNDEARECWWGYVGVVEGSREDG